MGDQEAEGLSRPNQQDCLDETTNQLKGLQINNISNQIEDLQAKLREYLHPLKSKMRQQRMLEESAPYYEMSLKLAKSLCHFIQEINFLTADQVICGRIYKHLQQDYFSMGCQQTDLDDYLECKPTELIAGKCCQVFIKILSGSVDLAFSELGNLDKLLSDARIIQDCENEQGFQFLANTLKQTLNVLADIELPNYEDIPSFEDLNVRSQCTVTGAKVYFMKWMRYMPQERIILLKQIIDADSTAVEWLVTLGEIYRRKRRESVTAKARRAAPEESEMLTLALSMDKDNPFVLMGLIDFMVDHLRDSKGRFRVGDIQLDNQEDIMISLQEHCRYIIKKYPRNVSFISVISDYFLRYVPFAYFDVDFGGDLLLKAYNLNPENPKTTHRLGIYYRMSMEDMDSSFKWFRKTTELDPTHFNAVMEYYKTALGKLDHSDVVSAMRNQLNTKELGCWSEVELHEFKFLLSLAYFAKGEKEETLQLWGEIVARNQIIFRLPDLDRTCGFYHWDPQKLSSDKLRLWMKAEKDLMAVKIKAGEQIEEKRNNLVDLLFSIMLGGGRPSKMESILGPFSPSHRSFGLQFQNMLMLIPNKD